MEKHKAIEVNQTPRVGSKEHLQRLRVLQDLIRRGAADLGLKVVTLSSDERKNSADHRGNPVEHLENLRAMIPGILIPKTVGYDEWAANPRTGVVAKNTEEAHGKGKYLIRTEEQIGKLKGWVEAKEGRAEAVRKGWAFQDFVDCPGDRFTAFRVISDCTGATLAGQLMYSHEKDRRMVEIQDRFPRYNHEINKIRGRETWDYSKMDHSMTRERAAELWATERKRGWFPTAELEQPTSPHFLGAEAIAANRMFSERVADGHTRYKDPKGDVQTFDPKSDSPTTEIEQIGGRIVLSGTPLSHPISEEEEALLETHGLDPKHPQIPEQMRAQSEAIGRRLGVQDGVIKGLWFASDWIRDKKGDDHLMEVNYRPSLGAIRDACGGMDIINDFQAQLLALRTTFEHLAQLR